MLQSKLDSLLPFHRTARAVTGAALLLAAAALAHAATPRVHAIRHARIVTSPGHVIARGNVIMRDGLIMAVGADAAIPADARVWDGDSLTVYAGLVDAFVMPAAAAGPPAGGPFGGARPQAAASTETPKGAVHELPSVHAEYRVVENLPLEASQSEALRAAGFTAAQVAPRSGIVRGSSAVVTLGGTVNTSVVRSDAAQVMALEPTRGGYPGSLMGAISVLRQVFLDAKWYRDARAAAARRAGSERVPENLTWAALQPVIAAQQPVLMVADEMLEVLQASRIASEAGVAASIVTAGDEYKRVAAIAATGRTLIVPVHFPDAPDVADDANALEVRTEELRHWQAAPGNAAALAKAGVTFAFTANGLKDVKTFRANVAKAIARGLSEDAALAAVTTTPARLLGADGKLGLIAPGAIANLTVTRGPLFGENSKVREVWIDGARYEVAKDETSPKGEWQTASGASFKVAAEAETSVTFVAGDTTKATAVKLEDKRLRFTLPMKNGGSEQWDLAFANDAFKGSMVAGSRSMAVSGAPKANDKDKKGGKKSEPALVAVPVVMGNTEAWRMAKPAAPAAVLIKHATIWTSGPAGIITDGDLLVRGGKIAAVGKNLATPAGAVVIDGTGKHVAPGIIDEHSHSAILGNVNECTNSVTCEVRVQDVINSESVNLYRQLAGGGTMMHLLHGSCNSIGGQAAVLKNKWGAAPDELFYALAPGTVKFALGENPKQANFGADRTSRYPKTRSGVEQTIREAFLRAQDYDRAFSEFKAGKRALPPRRDLQLDALSEIIHGQRLIHCHSYRQDEILMLMRLTESFGFRVNTFTHILEGYKVADEMATHGASGMGFTDWWGYKQEVIDAIPYNGYLMWDRGVNVGFNSDSDELARRLNTEAAKAIKYGGVPREEALKMVTLNPAKSLKIDSSVGSLEPGKDADFALWSGEPLSPFSVCEQTWIEGRKYFDRAADLAGRDELAKERVALISAAKAAKKEGGPPMAGRGNWPPRYLEDTDQSGNECGEHQSHVMPFLGETDRKAKLAGQEGSR
ncbi:MAG: amidohydrolase family protein [Candidatus Eisenbacteria bacterium]